MSSVISLPSAAFVFRPAGGAPVAVAEPRVDPEAVEAGLRAELQAEYDQRLAEEIDRHDHAVQQRYEELFSSCFTQFADRFELMREEIRDQVVDFSIRLAEVIVRHHLPDQDMLSELVTKTLEPVSDLQGARVRLCPEDLGRIGDRILSGLKGGQHIVEVIEDPQLKTGDVIVESRNGILDARLDERLELLKETLYERSGRKDT